MRNVNHNGHVYILLIQYVHQIFLKLFHVVNND
jgi:hypothetical protein